MKKPLKINFVLQVPKTVYRFGFYYERFSWPQPVSGLRIADGRVLIIYLGVKAAIFKNY